MAVWRVATLCVSVLVTQCRGQRVVESSAGRLSGEAATDGDFYQFLGIPYGVVDDSNPFGAASPHPAIDGTFEANDDSKICPQLNRAGAFVGTLDCLRLNVYVPSSATETSQLPVMVYIHGGHFINGVASKSAINPKFLVRHNVIVVTIQYRVGAFGFMCLNRRAVPGNQGLKDQVLALKWVRDNIQAFGGNSNQVTLIGVSAGGHSIDLHLLSEQERIYNNVIIHSGSSLAATVLYEPDREAPLKLAAYLGISAESNGEALRSLRDADVLDIVRAATQLNLDFKPCAETKFDDVDAFITEYWVNSPVPKVQNVAVLIGFTEYERMMDHINGGVDHFQAISNIFHNYLNHTFDFDDDRISRMEDYSRRFYLGDDAVSQEFVWPVINFESDYLYNHPIQRSIRKYIESNAGDIFYYMFSYSGQRNEASLANLNLGRASHADCLRYLFDMDTFPQTVSAEDQVIIDRMTTMWTNFAKYSDPTPDTAVIPVRWTPIDQSANIYHCLRIDSDLTMERRPFNRRMAFWDLFYKLNNDYQRSFEALSPAEDDYGDSGSIITTGSWLNVVFTLLLVAVVRH